MTVRTPLLFAAFMLAGLLPGHAAAQTDFVCTEFIGYSQMGNTIVGGWGPYAARVMDGGGPDSTQLRWQNGGAAWRWADAAYAGWRAAPTGPCARSAFTPDRVIIDITHNEYLTTARTNGDPVGFMETRIRGFLDQARAHHPSARSFVIQPVVGGPNHTTTCAIAGLPSSGSAPHNPNDPSVVRASYNHPHIWSAIQRVVANAPGVTIGYDSQVRTCADYNDWEGHLNPAASQPIGEMIGSFYATGGGQTAPAGSSAPSAPAAPALSSAQPAPSSSTAPSVAPAPAPASPAAPAAATPELWLLVLEPARTFTLQMEPVATAPGDWYRVVQVDEGWILGVWELDPPEALVWIELGPEVALTSS
jgi:hypothetical protein